MNKSEHLFTCLSEECAEVIHRISKILRFGLKEISPTQTLTNEQRLNNELNDLLGVLEVMQDHKIFIFSLDLKAIKKKEEKIKNYMMYSQQQGTLKRGK